MRGLGHRLECRYRAVGERQAATANQRQPKRVGYLNEEPESCRARMRRLHPIGQHLGARRRFVNGPDERVA